MNEKKFTLMGILNVTPDSFFDGGRHQNLNDAVDHAMRMIADGADIIDIGGESSRPGSDCVSVAEELSRVIPVLEAIKKRDPISISIDTRKYEVASAAIDAGADLINDISAGSYDERILKLAADKKKKICLMHMRGNSKTMQKDTQYKDLIKEITDYFFDRINCAKRNGVADKDILLDPGIGFGKDASGNLMILKNLSKWVEMGYEILIGPSNKSFIGNLLGHELNKRLEGTLSAIGQAYRQGVKNFRVHDVGAVKRFLEMEQMFA